MLRSTSIIGGATIAGLAIGLLRTKIIAATLGPSGIGLLGMLNAIQTMGTSVAGMGLETSAVRQLSDAESDLERSRLARWAIISFAGLLASGGAIFFWLLRNPLAKLAMGSAEYSSWVGWIGIGVAVGIIGSVQLAAIQSHRRMGDFARIRFLSALVAAGFSVAAVVVWGIGGIVVAVLSMPITTCAFAIWYKRTLPPWTSGRFPGRELAPQWRILAGLGLTVMATAAIGSLTQAAVRSILAQQLGLEAAGLFQASFAISSLNLGIVLGAMVPEYYPRLSAVAKDSVAVERLLNHQIHIGLLLAAPALIAISAGAPILLKLLYSEAFTGASLLLRLQVAADCLRILGWALGFVLLARKASVAYLFPELIFGAVFIPVTWTAVPHYGLAATGVAYVAAYATSLTATATYIAKLHRISVSRSNALKAGTLFAVLLSVAAVSLISEWAALAIGALAFAGASYPAWLEIQRIRLAKEGVAPDSSGPAGGGPKVDV